MGGGGFWSNLLLLARAAVARIDSYPLLNRAVHDVRQPCAKVKPVMDNSEWTFAAVTIVPSVLASLSARPWLSARIRVIEYLQKRLDLVSSVLANHRNVLERKQIIALENEIKSITNELLVSSLRSQRDRFLAWDRQVWLKRILTLPRPQSVLDWISGAIFYLYLVGSIMYLLFAILPLNYDEEFPTELTLSMSLIIFSISVLARQWNLRMARKRVLAQ